jgi:L-serine kinase (ADP)
VSESVEFVLVPIGELRAHEEVEPDKVRRLIRSLTAEGVFVEPVLVARGSNVILNGHHRVAALRALGATRVPAWRVDYASDAVSLDRWDPGPAISKDEVVRRAAEGRLFPPRTTRHRWKVEPGPHPTPLADLGIPARSPEAHRRGADAGGPASAE